jgi:hypothetical protein
MPLTKLVVNNYNATSTSISLFFLTYSYYIYLVELNNIKVSIQKRVSLI